MLASDVRIEGFDYRDWQRLGELLRHPARPLAERSPDPAARSTAGLIAVHRCGRIVKLLHTSRGRLAIEDPQGQACLSAAQLAGRHGARWALRLDYGALEWAMEAFGAQARPLQGMSAQSLSLLAALHGELARGRLDWAWAGPGCPKWLEMAFRAARQPAAPATVRQVAQLLGRALDLIWPVGHGLVVGAFEAGELWTGVLIERAQAGICRVVGPAVLRRAMGPGRAGLEANHGRLCAAARQLVGPLVLGCSSDPRALRALLLRPRASELARARADGELCLDPSPAGMQWVLALDSLLGRLRPS